MCIIINSFFFVGILDEIVQWIVRKKDKSNTQCEYREQKLHFTRYATQKVSRAIKKHKKQVGLDKNKFPLKSHVTRLRSFKNEILTENPRYCSL